MGSITEDLVTRDSFKTRFIQFRRLLRKLKLIGIGSWPQGGTDIAAWINRNLQYKISYERHRSTNSP